MFSWVGDQTLDLGHETEGVSLRRILWLGRGSRSNVGDEVCSRPACGDRS